MPRVATVAAAARMILRMWGNSLIVAPSLGARA
jgi:hypothetical protein